MKKLLYPILGLALMFLACKKEESEVMKDSVPSESITMLLNVRGDQKDNLFIQGDQGLKSSALIYKSYVNPGDTMVWKLNEDSNIQSIEDIILISSDCGPLLEGDIVFNENKTQCWGIVASTFDGHAKYDIKYKYIDGTIVIVDPDAEIKPPKK